MLDPHFLTTEYQIKAKIWKKPFIKTEAQDLAIRAKFEAVANAVKDDVPKGTWTGGIIIPRFP